MERNNEKEAIKYPVLPGTEEWVKLNGHDEMIKVCKLPEGWIK